MPRPADPPPLRPRRRPQRPWACQPVPFSQIVDPDSGEFLPDPDDPDRIDFDRRWKGAARARLESFQ